MTENVLWPAAPAGHSRPLKAAVPCGRRTARTAAALAAVALAAHALLLVTHNHGPWLTALIAAMSVACGACAVKAWRKSSAHELSSLLVMSLAMMVLHLALFIGAGGTAAGHASHHAGHAGASATAHAGHSGGVSTDALPSGAASNPSLPATEVPVPEVQSAGMQGAGMLGIAGLELAVAWSAGLALRRQR
ncbi:hypothetical protein GCM10023081_17080 [Arthrobacter ginkgonis]|uniref:Uncharacterized protein n=1 Tax=Arthrobacter ginkgonis TaxID=1630594 RepID=A0ABP7C4D0_9MICC